MSVGAGQTVPMLQGPGHPGPVFYWGFSCFVWINSLRKLRKLSQQAQGVAEKQENQILFPLHLLIALVEEKDGIVRPVLEKCNVHPDAVLSEARRMLTNACRGRPECSQGCTSRNP